MSRLQRDERGSMVLVVLALAVVAMALGMGLARVGIAAWLQARAETAADAAALAAADQLALGYGSRRAEDAAGAAASDNGGSLLGCWCEGNAAEVVVRVEAPDGLGLPRPATARARAEVDLSRAARGSPP